MTKIGSMTTINVQNSANDIINDTINVQNGARHNK